MTQHVTILEWEGYHKDAPHEKLKLASPLNSFPLEILDLGPVLQHLDLSGTGLSRLPAEIGQLGKLRIAFFSNCDFKTFPCELAACAQLEMVAFRGNGMMTVPEGSLPPRLRWLILTGNQIESLPRSIGACGRLQKCMLSGNRLSTLPSEMASCRRLGLLRLAANRIEVPPQWLFNMPELAFLSLSGNPCCDGWSAAAESGGLNELGDIPWADVRVDGLIGEGASGMIFKGEWNGGPVAIKLFKGSVTSDGTPADELAACLVAGRHPNLIDTLGRIRHHPEKYGLVMQLVPAGFKALGQPPSLQSCTRDCYDGATELTAKQVCGILCGVAQAAKHMHGRGMMHGDLYAHNILVDNYGNAILGDFGAATIYGGHGVGVGGGDAKDITKDITGRHGKSLERLEVLGFAHLMEDVISLVRWSSNGGQENDDSIVAKGLRRLQDKCSTAAVAQRPSFDAICYELDSVYLR